MGQANVECTLHLPVQKSRIQCWDVKDLGFLYLTKFACVICHSLVFFAFLKVGTTSGFARSEDSGSVSTVS